MNDIAIAGMVVIGVVGIFCFCAIILTLGVLAILLGLGFAGRATKEGVEVVTTLAAADRPASAVPVEAAEKSSPLPVVGAPR